MNPALKLLTAFVSTYGVGLAVLYAIGPNSLAWYGGLSAASLAPPADLLLPLLIVAYALMSLALAVCWSSDPTHSPHAGWMRFYFIQLLFGAMWLYLFFALHSLLVAFFTILLFAFIVGALVMGAWEIDKRASYLLSPIFFLAIYFAFLNLNVWYFN